MQRMQRRTFLSVTAALTATSLIGCKSKAQKQAEAAVADVARLRKLIQERHTDSLTRALPIAAAAIAAKVSADLRAEIATVGAAFNELRNKTDDLRSAKRSYFAITDAAGDVAFVDDDIWNIVDRKLAAGFPAVKDALDGKGVTHGYGRYGGASEDALTFVDAVAIKKGDKILGALVSGWEAHESAEDMQRQLATELAMKTVQPKKRVKAKDKLQLVMDTPDVWVAVFHGQFVYLQEDAPQTLEDATKGIGLHAKTASGDYTGTFDVLNRGWGCAAGRIPSLGPDVGLAVLRHEP